MYTQELVREETIVQIFKLLAWLLPALGLFCGAILSMVKKRIGYLGWGIGLGLAGPLNLLLWGLYSLTLDRFGFDSVKALFLNIIIFILIGIVLGFFIAFLIQYHKKEA